MSHVDHHWVPDTSSFRDPRNPMPYEGPSVTEMDAVDRLQVTLKALGDLCVAVMMTGNGAWAQVAAELEKAAATCWAQCKIELPPASPPSRRSFKPSEAPDPFPIYENRAVG